MLGIATLSRLRKLFEEGDTDGNGTLDSQELALVLQRFCRQQRVARSIAAVKKEVNMACDVYGLKMPLDFPDFIEAITKSGVVKSVQMPEAARRLMLLGVGRRPDPVTPRKERLAEYLNDLRQDYEELMTEREAMRELLGEARRENVSICKENSDLCRENAALCQELAAMLLDVPADERAEMREALSQSQKALAITEAERSASEEKRYSLENELKTVRAQLKVAQEEAERSQSQAYSLSVKVKKEQQLSGQLGEELAILRAEKHAVGESSSSTAVLHSEGIQQGQISPVAAPVGPRSRAATLETTPAVNAAERHGRQRSPSAPRSRQGSLERLRDAGRTGQSQGPSPRSTPGGSSRGTAASASPRSSRDRSVADEARATASALIGSPRSPKGKPDKAATVLAGHQAAIAELNALRSPGAMGPRGDGKAPNWVQAMEAQLAALRYASKSPGKTPGSPTSADGKARGGLGEVL